VCQNDISDRHEWSRQHGRRILRDCLVKWTSVNIMSGSAAKLITPGASPLRVDHRRGSLAIVDLDGNHLSLRQGLLETRPHPLYRDTDAARRRLTPTRSTRPRSPSRLPAAPPYHYWIHAFAWKHEARSPTTIASSPTIFGGCARGSRDRAGCGLATTRRCVPGPT